MPVIKPKYPTAIDETATHFRASKRESGGYAITLYRFRGLPKYGQIECQCTPELKARNSTCHFCISERMGVRPQYKGCMGWSFHMNDPDPKEEDLLTIDKLYETVGDKVDGSEFRGENMYMAC